jgi:hypothetical protein
MSSLRRHQSGLVPAGARRRCLCLLAQPRFVRRATAKAREGLFARKARSAASTPADDIGKLDDLGNRGVISEEEFQRAKGRILA